MRRQVMQVLILQDDGSGTAAAVCKRTATCAEVDMMNAALNDPSSVRQWVPVKGELPKLEGMYYVTVRSWPESITDFAIVGPEGIMWYRGIPTTAAHIIAYIGPLPEPYKEDA